MMDAHRQDAAGVLFRHPTDRTVLLVQPAYKRYCDLPGGLVEPGETAIAAALREVEEELGLDLGEVLLPLLVADYLHATPARPAGIRWVFDGGILDTPIRRLRLQREEIRQVLWCDRARARTATEHAPMLQRRVQAAIEAQATQSQVMMIDGVARLWKPRREKVFLFADLPPAMQVTTS